MDVPVGPYSYTVKLIDRRPLVDGVAADAAVDHDRQRIEIYRELRPERRWSLFWHEWAHAIAANLDIRCEPQFEEEPLCNLLGLGMANITPRQVALLHVYMTQGIEGQDVIMLDGVEYAVPVVKLDA